MTAPRTTTRRRRTAVSPAVVELPKDAQGEGEAGSAAQPGSSDTIAADLEPIFPDPTNLTILGIPAIVNRLQTREVMAVIRIVINEMGGAVTELDLASLSPTAGQNPAKAEAAKQQILGFLIVALPNAADEIIKLLSGLVEPKDPTQSKVLDAIMHNPPPAVTLDLLSVVWDQERDDLTELLGKARQLFGFAVALQRTGKAGT